MKRTTLFQTGRLLFCSLLFTAAQSHGVDAILTDDTISSSARPTANYGNSKTLTLRTGQNVYLKFDLSTLPPGTTSAQISKATLKVWIDRVGKTGTFDVFPVTEAWEETALKGSALPALGMAEISGINMDAAKQRQYIALDLTALVQDWVDGTVVNNGVALTASSGSTIFAFLASKENVATGHLPELEISLDPLATPVIAAGNSSTSLFATSNQGSGAALEGANTSATGPTSGVIGTASSTSHGTGATGGVSGLLGIVTPTTPGGYSAGVRGINNGTGGTGIGVIGTQAGSGWGVYGETPSGFGVYGLTTNNSAASVGVRGETFSTNGIAVEAKYSGTGVGVALEIDNGAIRVAGVNKAAFVHTATVANKLSANGTDIDNPMCNGDPNCFLFVTQKLNPSGIVYNNSPVGVYYNSIRNKWEIFNQSNTAIPTNAQFNVLVIKQ